MNPDPTPLSYRQLMTELGALCAAKRTGTMFIATTDNHSARIGLVLGGGNIDPLFSFGYGFGYGLSDRTNLDFLSTYTFAIHERKAGQELPPLERERLLKLWLALVAERYLNAA